ncbi:hypothetical protein N9T65_01070 [Candidatus Pelagibacter sp.]|nr:hypothetical protein [Candidatus Pelagibacter sp.]MDA9663451.1 hypothetical protein [Candidatus Pelagibacter sp.]
MKKLLGFVILGLLLSGCATKVATIQAQSKLSKDAIDFKIPENKSRIYFLAGSCDAPLKKMDMCWCWRNFFRPTVHWWSL